ncbi:hypothetical protein NE237_003202 [Protea cynaroides]|uniref:ARM repeat superfamily protein n=1 Tax=Protea cynaroides TaxID=273540 RepID=A0A9Q0KGD7_9MAGN|nr:hypothetical protein NE237_003202 [Protea cynaroides]
MAPERPIEEMGEEEDEEEAEEALTSHPSAPSSELFDISTTVDPGYIISLIRKLLPHDVRDNPFSSVVNDHNGSIGSDASTEECAAGFPRAGAVNINNNEVEAMDTMDVLHGPNEREDSFHGSEHPRASVREAAWEDYGCILWDLAANRTHAEFMVENLILEVLLATLTVSKSARIKEISLGILANLACHEVPQAHLVSTKGLVEIVFDQLFIDDIPCLSETFWLLTLGLQGSEFATWTEALQPEPVLGRILWITENTLNAQLLEKSLELLLAMLEGKKIDQILLPSLVNLGLPSLLVNLLATEMDNLAGERMPERFPVLDLILRAIEALSVNDNYSQLISSNEELLRLVYNLVKLPDKVEVASSCVSSVVLISNILTDAPGLALAMSHDFPFLQGLLENFPLVSDDSEARSALWSVLARLLVQVEEHDVSPSNLHKYVEVLVKNLNFIEEDLIDHQVEESSEDFFKSSSTSAMESTVRTTLNKLVCILNRWTAATDDFSREHHLDHLCSRVFYVLFGVLTALDKTAGVGNCVRMFQRGQGGSG